MLVSPKPVANRAQARLEHAHVRGVRERGAVQVRVVHQRTAHAHPACGSGPRAACDRGSRARRRGSPSIGRLRVICSRISGGAPSSMRARRSSSGGKVSGAGVSGIGSWNSAPASSRSNDAISSRLTSSRCTATTLRVAKLGAVAHGHDLVVDRPAGLARAQEVRMQRMAGPVGRRSKAGRCKRLGEHVAAEHARHPVGRWRPRKQALFQGSQVEEREQLGRRSGSGIHGAACTTRRGAPRVGRPGLYRPIDVPFPFVIEGDRRAVGQGALGCSVR